MNTNERKITRTINRTGITYLYFNLDSMSVETGWEDVTGKALDIDSANDYMNKTTLASNEKFLKVTGVENKSVKYEMSEEKFMALGTVDYDRSERMVTRTIKSTIIKSLYFDLDSMATVEDELLVTGKELDIASATEIMNKGKYNGSRKFLKVLDCYVTTLNYGMTEKNFMTFGDIAE